MRRKRSARRRAFDWRQLPKILLLGGVAVFIGWLVVRAAAIDAFVRRNPAAAAVFAPGDPRVTLALAMAEFRRGTGAISPRTMRATRQALEKAPLAEEPFVLHGLSALVGKDEARAERLLTEARERNPRSRPTRLLLLDRYLRTNRVDDAAVEIAVLSRLIPAARQALVPELAKFAGNPRTRGSLASVLRSDPEMREEILNHLANSTGDPDLVLRLAETSGARIVPTETRPWQRSLLDTLVKKGEIERAYRLWARFTGAAGPASGKGIYDGRFQGLPGSPPFNWEFVSSGAGIAEKAKGPAVQVEYYGRQPTTLATQLLMLKPGRYRFAFRAEGDATGDGSKVAWTLECLPGTPALLELPITKLTYAGKVIAGDFTVPTEGCSAQWLRLVGRSAEFPSAQSVTITDVQVRSAGQS